MMKGGQSVHDEAYPVDCRRLMHYTVTPWFSVALFTICYVCPWCYSVRQLSYTWTRSGEGDVAFCAKGGDTAVWGPVGWTSAGWGIKAGGALCYRALQGGALWYGALQGGALWYGALHGGALRCGDLWDGLVRDEALRLVGYCVMGHYRVGHCGTGHYRVGHCVMGHYKVGHCGLGTCGMGH